MLAAADTFTVKGHFRHRCHRRFRIAGSVRSNGGRLAQPCDYPRHLSQAVMLRAHSTGAGTRNLMDGVALLADGREQSRERWL